MRIKIKIGNYYYYNNFDDDEKFNAPVLCLKGRSQEKKNHQIQILDKENLAPHFGILRSEFDEYPLKVVKVENGVNSLYGELTKVLYTTFPFEVGRIRKEKKYTQTFQADIKWEKMADNGLRKTAHFLLLRKNGLNYLIN